MSIVRNRWQRNALAGGATALTMAMLAVSPAGAIVTEGPGDGEAPVVTAGGTYEVDEGGSVVITGIDVYDPDGDYFEVYWYPGDGLDDTSSISPTYTAGDSGTYTLDIVAFDETGLESYDSITVIVNNVEPTVGEIEGIGADPVPVGTSVSVSTTATDPGTTDTHTWTVDWGDGTTSTGTGLTPTDSHDYADSGIYTVSITVTDSDGASTTSVADSYVVIYDPSGGFVTGGGWIDSPAGAYTPEDSTDEDLTGKATFGFVAKYKNGASAPMGSTEFQFHANGMNFHSTSYDWLVVAGTKAMFKGEGRVNGVDGYQFQLTAKDGKNDGPDTFRIKIVDLANDTVLYDNQHGDADLGDATTELTKGNIVVHK